MLENVLRYYSKEFQPYGAISELRTGARAATRSEKGNPESRFSRFWLSGVNIRQLHGIPGVGECS